MYAFSCTTFVHYCYAESGVMLVLREEWPLMTAEERATMVAFHPPLAPYIASDPVRRLSCAHLICAFEAEPEAFPWRPHNGDWTPCADKPTFERLINAAGLL